MTLQKIKTVEKAAHNAVYTYYRITLFMLFQAFSFSDMSRKIFFGLFFFIDLIFWFVIIISVFITRDFQKKKILIKPME